MVVEERGSDHHAEHGVAEELQPLIGGQPAVLVGVRAVGQRTFQQLRVEGHAEGGLQVRQGRSLGHPDTSTGRGAAAASRAAASTRCSWAASAMPDAMSGPSALPWQTTTRPPMPSRTAARGTPGAAAASRPAASAYAPSMPLSRMLPVNPSVTTTSAGPPSGTSYPSTVPAKTAPSGSPWAPSAAAAARRDRSPLPGSVPLNSRPTRGAAMPWTIRAYAAPSTACCTSTAALASVLAPRSSRTSGPARLGRVAARAGRRTPGRRASPCTAAVTAAPRAQRRVGHADRVLHCADGDPVLVARGQHGTYLVGHCRWSDEDEVEVWIGTAGL